MRPSLTNTSTGAVSSASATSTDSGIGLPVSIWTSVPTPPAVDVTLARELWADVDPIVELGELGGLGAGQVDYDDAPYGVQYWVVRWSFDS